MQSSAVVNQNIVEDVEDVVVTEEPNLSDTDTDEPDDLTRIEGIGPTYSKALTSAGISTFANVAESSIDELRNAIESAGSRVPASVETWAEQATLARDGKWEELDKLQDDLKGGRRV